MSLLTDDFDIVLQVKEGAIQRILQAQHTAGSFRHTYVRNYDEKRIDLVINLPNLTLLDTAAADNQPRALLQGRVFYHARTLSDPDDMGEGAVADVAIRLKLNLSSGDPAPLAPDTRLVQDWGETRREDITVHGVSAGLQSEVKDALMDFIRLLQNE